MDSPALTIALSLVAGVIAYSIAHHLRIPGIVLLLATGALLGPEGVGLIKPELIGHALHALVGFAVSVILFEGGLNLNWNRLRRESAVIQRLITVGAIVTAAGGAVAAHMAMKWNWETSILFGTLIIVTGPTVVTPLLRRIRVRKNLQTILEAEGVLIDPIGAIIAVVALEIALSHGENTFSAAILGGLVKIGVGMAIGMIGGVLLALVLRSRHLIPEGLENVFTLAIVLALYHVSNALHSESGIASVTVAGLVVGNMRTRALRDLMDFKEGLTVLLIGMLFVLLSADVRWGDLRVLGSAGLWTVAALMFVVRPVNIVISTLGSTLTWRERVFMMWLAPRGIVAAAVASLFAASLEDAGAATGGSLQAEVFLVIAVTVTVQGLTGGVVAKLLSVRRQSNTGYLILGANEIGRLIGRLLREHGEDITFLDANTEAVEAAADEGFRIVFGNALEERTRQRAGLDGVAGCLAVTPNEEINLLFTRRVREEFKVARTYLAPGGHVTRKMIEDIGARVLFGESQDLTMWEVRARRKLVRVQQWRCARSESNGWPQSDLPEAVDNAFVPLLYIRGKTAVPFDESVIPQKSDQVVLMVFTDRLDTVTAWLVEKGWDLNDQRAVTDR